MNGRATGGGGALAELAALLRAEATVISPHVVESNAAPALGVLAAAGPSAAPSAGEYALVVEAVREGYLLHYGEPRLLAGHDADLGLLAGDYLYALGLERLAALGDQHAVGELSDLISICAQLHAEGRPETAGPLWLACAAAVGGGGDGDFEQAKAAARSGDPRADLLLWEAAASVARDRGAALARAAEAIDFAPPR